MNLKDEEDSLQKAREGTGGQEVGDEAGKVGTLEVVHVQTG